MSKADDALRLLESGLSHQEIAVELGVGRKHVGRLLWIARHPDKAREIDRRQRRARYHKHARAAGIPSGHHRRGCKRSYERDNAAVIRDVDEGLSFDEAAKKHRITRSTVAGIVWRRPEAEGVTP